MYTCPTHTLKCTEMCKCEGNPELCGNFESEEEEEEEEEAENDEEEAVIAQNIAEASDYLDDEKE